MLLCRSSGAVGPAHPLRRGAEMAEDLAGDVAFEAADDLGLGLVLPSMVRLRTWSRVGGWPRMRVTTTRCRAALAWRSPPRLSRCRMVLPLEAGIGQVPHSSANA